MKLPPVPTRPRDEFGRAAARLCGRIAAMGPERALQQEFEKPSLPDDPDWATMIIAILQGKDPPPPRGEDLVFAKTYTCLSCHDSGYILVANPRSEVFSARCKPCLVRAQAKALETKGRKPKNEDSI